MQPTAHPMDPNRRRDNIRTGLVLACLAAAFFFGFIAKFWVMR